MGADFVIYALEQLGVEVSPTIAWIILIFGSLLLLGAGFAGIISLYRFIRRHKMLEVLMSIRLRSPLFRKPHQITEEIKIVNGGNQNKENQRLTRLQIDILKQLDYDKYHLKDRMVVRDGRITFWKLDPVYGGTLEFSLDFFNGSVFPSVKVGHVIEGKLFLQGKEFHDRPEIKLPQNSTHGCWVTIVVSQPVLPEVIKKINEGASKPGGIDLRFDFHDVKIFAEVEGGNTGLIPQNTLELPPTLKYRVKYESGVYSWQLLYDVSIS